MKQLKSIIALLAVLILLSAAYVYIKAHPKASSSSTSTTATDTTAQIWKLDSSKASKVILTDKDNSLSFVKNGTNWNIANYNYKVDQTSITTVIDEFTTLSATRIVESTPADTDKYGFNKVTKTVKIEMQDKTEKVLNIGDKASDGNYYAMIKDDKKVYLIAGNLVDEFSKKSTDFRDKTITSIDSTKLKYIFIAQAGVPNIELKANDSQSDQEAQNGINSWNLTQPYSYTYGGSDTNLQTVTAAIANIKATSVVDEGPKNLATYGLDKPSMEITLKDDKATLHLIVGKKNDDSTSFFKLADSNTIYTIDDSVLASFKVKPFDMASKFAYIVNIDTVDKIAINSKDSKIAVDFSRTTKKAEKSGDKDTVVTTYKVDNKNIEESKFKTLYQELIGLSVDAENDKKLEDKPEVSITYTLNTGSAKTVSVNFVPYNDQFYAVYRGGKSDFLIAKTSVNKMIDDFKNIK
jgi:hypothetical protein